MTHGMYRTLCCKGFGVFVFSQIVANALHRVSIVCYRTAKLTFRGAKCIQTTLLFSVEISGQTMLSIFEATCAKGCSKRRYVMLIECGGKTCQWFSLPLMAAM